MLTEQFIIETANETLADLTLEYINLLENGKEAKLCRIKKIDYILWLFENRGDLTDAELLILRYVLYELLDDYNLDPYPAIIHLFDIV